MTDLLGSLYPWLKAAHIISVIAWMAGLLYLPRLFVYHCAVPIGSEQSETFKTMERRLLRVIMTPAMVAAWVFGLILVAGPADAASGWFMVKLLLVLALSGLHGLMAGWHRDFAADQNRRSQRFFRFANEAPTLLMIVIVLLAVVKPF